jgi:apolipoprotein N-acyltransferase
VLVASVTLGEGTTPYTVVGELFGWLLLALTCAAGVTGMAGSFRWTSEPSVAPR